MTKRRGKIGLERWFVITSAILGIVMLLIAIYAIAFLSNNLFKALVPGNTPDTGTQFDLEGYEEVIMDLGRTPAVTTE